jgi:hypothetical protein
VIGVDVLEKLYTYPQASASGALLLQNLEAILPPMSATLYVDGIRITVPTSELAEAMHQLSLWSGKAGTTAVPKIEQSAARQLDVFTEESQKKSTKQRTLEFLRVIEDHEVSGGAPVATVMSVLGASHAKGVGSKAAIVNRVLDRLGFAIPDVYLNPRDAHGDRYWKGGPRLRDAIEALSQTNEPTSSLEEEEEEEPDEDET